MDGRLGHAAAGQGRHLVGHSQHGEAIEAIGGKLQVQDGVPQVFVQGRAQRGLVRQHHDAAVVVAQPQFQLGAYHPLGLDAPDGGGRQRFPLAGMGVIEIGADPAEANLLAFGHVRRAADDLGLVPAGADSTQTKAVGIGVGPDAGDQAHIDLAPPADLLNFTHLDAGHGQPVGQFMGIDVDFDVLPKPTERYFHELRLVMAGIRPA